MRAVKSSIILIIFTLFSRMVLAVDSEEQKQLNVQDSADVQGSADVQNTLGVQNTTDMKITKDIQKLMELQKHLELQKIQSLQKELEEQEFRSYGFNSKHYRIAKLMNLDAENYNLYYANRRNRRKGNRLMGIGGGVATIGLIFAIDGIESLIKGPARYKNNGHYDYSDHLSDCFAIGGTCIGTGLGLMISGVIKRNKIKDVYTKDGKQLFYR
ncbi:MAG: hypothetical protein GX267_17795 [Fibrobacter sp.]|nr:hypothetical protein [Fibrobacter sp.]